MLLYTAGVALERPTAMTWGQRLWASVRTLFHRQPTPPDPREQVADQIEADLDDAIRRMHTGEQRRKPTPVP